MTAIIVSLETSNVKRLHVVSIEPDPDGSLVIIGGDNAQGKTCVLDSIEYAMTGKRSIPPKPVRDGEDSAKVVVKLSNGLVVTRTFTAAGGGTVRVGNGEGALYTSPQKILDKLLGDLFDPLAFDGLRPAERLATLAKLVGIDFTELDAERLGLTEARRVIGVSVRQAEGAIAEMPFDSGAPGEEISISELALKLEEADNAVQLATDAESALVKWRDEIARLETQTQQQQGIAEREASALRQRAVDAELAATNVAESNAIVIEDLRKGIPAAEEQALAKEGHEAARGTVRQQLRAAEATNILVRQNIAKLTRVGEVQVEQAAYAAKSAEIVALDVEKQDMVEAAEFPIEGLGLGDGDVCFQGQPWEQCSLAERMSVCVAMGFALNPDFRVLLIREGSALDAKHLALLDRLAAEQEGQLWIERVGDHDEAAIIIQDGRVRGAEDAPPAADGQEQPELPIEA